MEWIEIRAKTLAEAIERALDALGVHETELEYSVVQEPKSALFGLRRTEAHIRARVRPKSREKPNDRKRRGRDAGAGRTRKPASAKAAASGAGSSDRKETAEGKPATGPAKSPSKRRRRSGSRPSQDDREQDERHQEDRNQAQSAGTRAATRKESEESEMPTETLSVEEVASAARRFTEGLIDAFDFAADIEVVTSEEAVEVRVTGEDLGLLVGPKGATLASIEELLRDCVGHRAPGVRLHLDVAGYRARRREALADFAHKVAEQVIASATAKALEPMSAADRKVVHDAVADIEGVTTISDGEDPRRRVVIKPS